MRTFLIVVVAAGWLSSSTALAAAPNLPDHARTPGASDPTITNLNYRATLCADDTGKKYHTTDEKRPNSDYTTALKKRQLSDWKYPDRKVGDYEEDHLISLELGGDDSDEANLWPEPYGGRWGARIKDTLEGELGKRICLKETDRDYTTLTEARRAVSGDWIASGVAPILYPVAT
jgi:hypothetical protein